MGKIERVFQEAVNSFYAGNFGAAEQLFLKTLRKVPRHVGALNLLTVTLMRTNRPAEAEEFAHRASSLPEVSEETFSNYGLILKQLGKHKDALDQFDWAIKLNPSNAETWNSRGATLNNLARFEDAASSLDKAILLNPDFAGAYCNRGKSRLELSQFDLSLSDYDRAIAIKADLAAAWCGRGYTLAASNRFEDAFASYQTALAFDPDMAAAWCGQGIAFAELGHHQEALAALEKALAIKPDLTGAEGLRIHSKMHCCDWQDLATDIAKHIASVRNGTISSPPFSFLTMCNSPEAQYTCARMFANPQHAAPSKWDGQKYQHDRIRIAYLSADFYEHATAQLIAGMFECHDRSRFEVTGISCGRDDKSKTRKRLEASFERFIDAKDHSDSEIANFVKSLEIDLLVDLKGFTSGARWNVLARRPAPMQVNFLGFPGTMGAPFIDYIIADQVVIPERDKEFYAEKICFLPDSYQVNDSKRQIGSREISRSELGLPRDGFVFCCFNNNYKIMPYVFDIWMRILTAVPQSVLWLLESNAAASRNLKREAVSRGIEEGRLVFAQRMPIADHLPRHKCADLFLDTLPYNAHTPASDALWAGLPVLTRIGEAFAGRVAASLLTAIHLPELIVETANQYQELAIELAKNPSNLARIRETLSANRRSAPLFDTALFTKHIETAYHKMHERFQAGLLPDHIYIDCSPKIESGEELGAVAEARTQITAVRSSVTSRS